MHTDISQCILVYEWMVFISCPQPGWLRKCHIVGHEPAYYRHQKTGINNICLYDSHSL